MVVGVEALRLIAIPGMQGVLILIFYLLTFESTFLFIKFKINYVENLIKLLIFEIMLKLPVLHFCKINYELFIFI